MKDTLISFETAKLAKEKGFDIPVLYHYNKEGKIIEPIIGDQQDYVMEKFNEYLENYNKIDKATLKSLQEDSDMFNKLTLEELRIKHNNFDIEERDLRKYREQFINEVENYIYKYSAPTQSLLQKWLREFHNIHIVLFGFINNTYWHYEIYTLNKAIIEFDLPSIKHGNTYEEALETGLQEALKLITSK